MRVLHLLATNQRRGAETFAVELAAYLVDHGVEVELLAVEPSSNGPLLDVGVAGRHRADPRGAVRIWHAVQRADVVVGFGSTTLLSGALVSALAQRPFVYRNIGDPRFWGQVRGARLRIGWPLRRAARVVAVFPRARDTLIERYGLDPDRVVCIPRGVPLDRWPVIDADDRHAARKALGLDDRPWLVWIGSLSDEKNPLTAIRAVKRAEDAGLLMCGDGPLRSEVETELLTLGDRGRFLGAVSDVRPVITAADALLLTSRTEGVPGVIIEAGLSGLPAIAPDVGGVSWVVQDRITGRVYGQEGPDAILGALRDVLADPSLGTAARKRCEAHFSMDAVGRSWETILREVAGGGGR
jgi:glycosyltransferase involved in cell wall biosynthesis